MRPFLLKLSAFALSVIFSYALLLKLWVTFLPIRFQENVVILNNRKDNFTAYRLQDIKHYQKVDILFLGSSHALRQFDPRVFNLHGYSSYNFGSNAQSPIQSEKVLNKIIDLLDPKTVILETYPYYFETENTEGELDIVANGLDDLTLHNFLNAVGNGEIKLFNTYVYSLLEHRTSAGTQLKAPKLLYAGYLETDRKTFHMTENHYRNSIWLPRKDQTQAFDNIVSLLKKKHIRLILVQAPVTKPVYNYLKNNDQIDAYFRSRGEYYNFNKILDLKDTTCFYDSDHLNLKGVKIFDEAVIKICLKKK